MYCNYGYVDESEIKDMGGIGVIRDCGRSSSGDGRFFFIIPAACVNSTVAKSIQEYISSTK